VAASANLAPTFYPSATHLLEDAVRPICSEHGGITQSVLVSPISHCEGLSIKSITAQMPAYHKVLLNPDADVQYHLGGYGTFHEEALVRLVGEAIERYSLLVAPRTMSERICYTSYDEIVRRGPTVPFEYLRLFSDQDYARLDRGHFHGMRRLERTDVVGWIQCPSLFEPDVEIWTPAQMLFVGYTANRAAGEVPFNPGFSTGTAAHQCVEKALQSALLEFIEIDALMLRWYTEMPAPQVTIDNLGVAALAPELLRADAKYDVLALDLSVLPGVDAHVFGSVVVRKRAESPYLMLGAQGHLNPVKAFYRSLMEAVSISFLGIYGPLFLPKEYLSADGQGFTDLDTNVAFFVSSHDAPRKRAAIERLISGKRVLSGMRNYDSGDVGEDTARLIQQLSAFSKYGVFLDVTPPETVSRGWKVMRVFLPELVTMCVPGVPYTEHPRMKAHGGVRNEYPHPLP
jgi:thiazole/oxazole-forming peptide maturase SagD family component